VPRAPSQTHEESEKVLDVPFRSNAGPETLRSSFRPWEDGNSVAPGRVDVITSGIAGVAGPTGGRGDLNVCGGEGRCVACPDRSDLASGLAKGRDSTGRDAVPYGLRHPEVPT